MPASHTARRGAPIGTLLLARSATASPAVAVLADDGPPTANAAAIPADWDWQIGDLVLRRRDARELYFPHDVSRGETTESIRALIWTGVPAGTLAVGAATLRALGPEIDASLILPRITDVDAGRHVAVRADLRGTEYVDPPSGGGGQGQSGVTGFHISATAPANARAGWLWSDTSSNTLKRYDGSAWIEVGASDGFHVGAAAPGTASAGEYWSDTSSNTLKRYDGSAWIVQQHGASLDSLVGARAPVALSQAQSRLDLNSPAGAAVTARTAVVALPSAASAGDRLVARWAWHARPGAPAHPLCTIGLRDVTGAADLDVIWPIWDADAGILSWDLPAGCASVQFIGRFDPVEAGGAHATIDISAVEMHSGAQAISRYVEGRARRVASLAAAQATAREADARAAQDVQILATLQTSIEGVLHLAHLVSIWRRAGPKPAAPAPAAGDYTGPGQWSVLPAGWYTSPAAVPARRGGAVAGDVARHLVGHGVDVRDRLRRRGGLVSRAVLGERGRDRGTQRADRRRPLLPPPRRHDRRMVAVAAAHPRRPVVAAGAGLPAPVFEPLSRSPRISSGCRGLVRGRGGVGRGRDVQHGRELDVARLPHGCARIGARWISRTATTRSGSRVRRSGFTPTVTRSA